MATRKKPTIIPEVDIIKAGVDIGDAFKKMRDDDGYIKVSRSKAGNEIKKEVVKEKLDEQEEKLAKLKERLDEVPGKIKKKKKDKKGKKKKDKKESYDESLLNAVPSDLAEYIRSGGKKKKDKKGKKKKDKKEKLAGLRI